MKKRLLALLSITAFAAIGCSSGSKGGSSQETSSATSHAETSSQEASSQQEQSSKEATSSQEEKSSEQEQSSQEATSSQQETSAQESTSDSEEPVSAESAPSQEDPSSEEVSSEEASSEEQGLQPAKLRVRFHVDSGTTEGMAYQKLIDGFNKAYAKYEIKATADFVARTAGDSAYERQLATDKMDGTLPDVITFDAPNCASYANSGYLYDISNQLTDEEKSQYVTLNSYNGKTYGVPIQESSAGFYYNKDLFRDAGIDVSGITVANPWTYEQFKDVCAKLAAKNITPVDMRMDATKDETATYLLYPFVYASGGSFVDSTGRKATGYFNSDASKRGFQFLKDLLKAKYTSYAIGATDFHTGKVGMYLSSGWTIPELDHKFPTTFPDRSHWGLLPYPQDVKRASANGSWSYAVGNNDKNTKKEAVALLKYLSNAASSKTITDATGMIPANNQVETHYEENSPESVLIQQLYDTSICRPVTVGYPQFSSAFSQVISGLGSTDDVSGLVDNKAKVLQTNLDRIRYND